MTTDPLDPRVFTKLGTPRKNKPGAGRPKVVEHAKYHLLRMRLSDWRRLCERRTLGQSDIELIGQCVREWTAQENAKGK